MPTHRIPKTIHSSRPARVRPISRIVWQTFITDLVPAMMHKAATSWSSKNPDCDYRFLVDADCAKMIADFDPELFKCYERTPPGAFRADIWRYCALYRFGGIYADMDTVCKLPMKQLIKDKDQFIVAYDANKTKLFNAFMCSAPAHPVLEKVLSNIKSILLDDERYQLIQNNPALLYDITGPGGLARAVAEVTGLPEGITYSAKTYSTKDVKVRILRKLHKKPLWSRRVMVGLRTILLCKYEGYFEDIKAAGGTHWSTSKAETA